MRTMAMVDPIELEIFKSIFVSIAEEMGGGALPLLLFTQHQGEAGFFLRRF
jgi:hypothetical protein